MTVNLVKGDLFDYDGQYAVNAVNTVGVMGKGVALGFKLRYPAYFDQYVAFCHDHELRAGNVWLASDARGIGKHILNAATKGHWKYPSDHLDVKRCFEALALFARNYGVEEIACPALGCGEGGVEWATCLDHATEAFEQSACELRLYSPMSGVRQVLS
jgi:O-acetyl-ADP-ribose deacetylase (regulator of RNase III)